MRGLGAERAAAARRAGRLGLVDPRRAVLGFGGTRLDGRFFAVVVAWAFRPAALLRLGFLGAARVAARRLADFAVEDFVARRAGGFEVARVAVRFAVDRFAGFLGRASFRDAARPEAFLSLVPRRVGGFFFAFFALGVFLLRAGMTKPGIYPRKVPPESRGTAPPQAHSDQTRCGAVGPMPRETGIARYPRPEQFVKRTLTGGRPTGGAMGSVRVAELLIEVAAK